LGVPIPEDALRQMEEKLDEIDFERVSEIEKETKHDVMAHIHHFGEVAPLAKGYIHLGATSCDITDNADLILMNKGLKVLEKKLQNLIYFLKEKALEYKKLPCLGYTHLQVAQPTTLGKRLSLYLQDFLQDFLDLKEILEDFPLRGLKGATGTQNSFLNLLGDEKKVEILEKRFVHLLGFYNVFPVTGQTYPRKMDCIIGDTLKGIGISAGKFSRDMRVMQSFGEVQEPFGSKQVGSSAMPFKQNPMKMERVTSLSRYLINLINSLDDMASEQFLERTLDDSAQRRFVIPQSFFMCDGILSLCIEVIKNIKVNEEIIKKRLKENLPFLSIETILMEWVKKGGDRQVAHNILKEEAIRAKNRKNTLFKNLLKRADFPFNEKELKNLLKIKNFIGLAKVQVERFVKYYVEPHLKDFEEVSVEIKV
ncbi:MAG: adenylosuccinate lyase, partial [Thermoanaerobaculia bacterium]